MKKEVMAGVAQLEQFDEELYKVHRIWISSLQDFVLSSIYGCKIWFCAIVLSCPTICSFSLIPHFVLPCVCCLQVGGDGDDKYLIATSEQPLCGYHMNEWIPEKDLPLKYSGKRYRRRKIRDN